MKKFHQQLKILENELKEKEFFAGHSIWYLDIVANVLFGFHDSRGKSTKGREIFNNIWMNCSYILHSTRIPLEQKISVFVVIYVYFSWVESESEGTV